MPPASLHLLVLFGAAVMAGAMNAVAGGGSFFSFPALYFGGMEARMANATNTVALWPGSVASVAAYRRELREHPEATRLLAPVSLVGGLLGALLLLLTPTHVFQKLLPFLMLAATCLFAFSRRINLWLRSSARSGAKPGAGAWRTIVLQGLIAVYGGYFGGGIGILMLATLALMGMEDIHEMNAVKTLLATLINGIAVVTFAFARVVSWHAALLMACGAIIGGYGGAALSRRLDQGLVRMFVVCVGFMLSAYLFLRGS